MPATDLQPLAVPGPPTTAAGAPAPVVVEVVASFGDRVVDVRHVQRRDREGGDRYVIGEGPQVDLPVVLPPQVDRAGVPLILALPHQAVLGLVPGMTGELVIGAETLQLADLLAQGRRSYALPPGARGELALGEVRFSVRLVDPAVLALPRRPVDRLYWLTNLGSLAVIAALVGLGEPRQPGELTVEEVQLARARAAHYISDIEPRAPEPPPPRPQVSQPSVPKARSTPKPAPAPAAAPPPASPPLAVGAGADRAPPKVAQGSRRGIRGDYDHARTAGVLGDSDFAEGVARVTAITQESMLHYRDTPEDLAFWGGVKDAPARVRPMGGLEMAETERGGGVHGEKNIKDPNQSGPMVTVSGAGKPSTITEEERRIARLVVAIRFETPYVQGDMNADSVQTALRQQEGGLRACYKAAVGAEGHRGTVIFKLHVNVDGKVTHAALDWGSSKFPDIGPCLEKTARGMKLPPPLDHKPAKIVVEALFTAKQY
ncbi:MAG: hypothetical protein JNL82_28355 [Myxococcales bacterium]|nr:hypothetical protein [Myxococcales bacterium]